VEEIVWCEPANALALRAIFLSRQWLDKRIHDPGRLDGFDSSKGRGVTAAQAVAPWSSSSLFRARFVASFVRASFPQISKALHP